MASIIWISFLISSFFFHLPPSTNAHPGELLLFDAIYQFGDSLSDTGNFGRLKVPNVTFCTVFPYGETFFGYPTGRCSDGLLMVDFIAKAYGLPFLNPYMDATADLRHGVDFSIGGATALDAAALEANNISVGFANDSLPVEMTWFKTYLQSICSTSQACEAKLANSLFIMGEIGGNDINNLFWEGKSFESAYSLIPDIVQAIKNALQELINVGATYIIVPGNFPIGCIPNFLWNYGSNDTSKYDDLKCLKSYNQVAECQNDQMQEAIRAHQEQNPSVTIAYADFYNAYIWLLQNAASLGFEEEQVFNPCCGTLSNGCGNKGAPLCANPKTRLSWDGLHPTHQANKYMTHWILSNLRSF